MQDLVDEHRKLARLPVFVAVATLIAGAAISWNALVVQSGKHPAPMAGDWRSTASVKTRVNTTTLIKTTAVNTPERVTTIIKQEKPKDQIAGLITPESDPLVKSVQQILKGLKLYGGEVDGLTGPGTRKAVTSYQKRHGLKPHRQNQPGAGRSHSLQCPHCRSLQVYRQHRKWQHTAKEQAAANRQQADHHCANRTG